MTDEEWKKSDDMLERIVQQLGEHYENVRIFANTSTSDGKIIRATQGAGNFFAQYGQIREWLIHMDEYAKQEARGNNDDE